MGCLENTCFFLLFILFTHDATKPFSDQFCTNENQFCTYKNQFYNSGKNEHGNIN